MPLEADNSATLQLRVVASSSAMSKEPEAVSRYTGAVAAGTVSAVCDMPERWSQTQLLIFLGVAESEYNEVLEKAAAAGRRSAGRL